MQIVRHGKREQPYRGDEWWNDHTLRCKYCGCRYRLNGTMPRVRPDYLATDCPECGEINVHSHSRFGRFMDWWAIPSLPGRKVAD